MDQAGLFQLRQVSGKISTRQAGQALNEDEIGAFACGKSRQDRIVPVYLFTYLRISFLINC